ncbi:MAG: hypothetical protein EBX37_17200 [Alphaproteobacteria bacterium]|nr:hypothetical protein [Alphaproteobacteria bacterium]
MRSIVRVAKSLSARYQVAIKCFVFFANVAFHGKQVRSIKAEFTTHIILNGNNDNQNNIKNTYNKHLLKMRLFLKHHV